MENQEPTGDLSQSYPFPELEFSVCQSRISIDSDPKKALHRYFTSYNKREGFKKYFTATK